MRGPVRWLCAKSLLASGSPPRRLLFLVFGLFIPRAVEASANCLPDAIPLSQRRNLNFVTTSGTQDGSESLPLGIWVLSWASAQVSAQALRIIFEERLGINTVLGGYGDTSPTGYLAVTGCKDPLSYLETQCLELNTTSRWHVVTETWPSALGGAMEEVARLWPNQAPENLGTMGYQGHEFMSITQGLAESAYDSTGLALEFYRSYDSNWNEPWNFFVDYRSVELDDLKTCSETYCSNADHMQLYLQHTQDYGGVESVNGELRCKCDSTNRWWLSPACRQNPERCVPMVTGGSGWAHDHFMQKTTTFNIPAAVATLNSYSATTAEKYNEQLQIYMWSPDTTFIQFHPVTVNYPEHNAALWSHGDKTTQVVGLDLGKWGYYSLRRVDQTIHEVIRRLKFTLQELNGILLDIVLSPGEGAIEMTTCQWLRDNQDIWEAWIPDQTRCAPGFGIQDRDGRFVEVLSNATRCDVCTPGLRSVPTPDSLTRICEACEAGTYSSFSAEFCVDCSPGRFAASAGSSSCMEAPIGHHVPVSAGTQPSRCELGTYSDETGLQFCKNCTVGHFTSQLGSVVCVSALPGYYAGHEGMAAPEACPPGKFAHQEGQSWCLNCAQGEFASSNTSTACQRCGMGSFASVEGAVECERCRIPGTSTLGLGSRDPSDCVCDDGTFLPAGATACQPCGKGLLCRQGRQEILPGFYGETYDSIFKCHVDARMCVGGSAGQTCAKGRFGISCASCERGTYASPDGTCQECSSASQVLPILVCLCITAGLVIVYYVMDSVDHSMQSHATLLCAVCASLCITLVQQLGILSSLEVAWEPPLVDLLYVLRMMTMEFELLQVDCLIPLGPLSRLLAKLLFILSCAAIIGVTHLVFVMCAHQQRFRESLPSLVSTLGMVCMVCYMTVIMAMLGPLQCMPNPNELLTSRAYPSVVCWETAEHTKMVIISAVSMMVPIAFLCHCGRVVVNLPCRMAQGNTLMLRKYSFLFFRYKPDAYWFSTVHFARSLLFTLIPLLPDIVLQMFGIQLLLLLLFTATLYYMPWRVWQATLLDLGSMILLMLFMYVCAFMAPQDHVRTLSAKVGCGLIGTACLLAVGFFSYAVITACRKRHHKPIAYFICHHKQGAGCCARLLKVFLSEIVAHQGAGMTVFIDSDDLKDLDTLFDIVRSDTQNLVAVCTEELLRRPWCVGEVVTAQLSGVGLVKLKLSGYTEPDELFINKFRMHVPDITCLTSRGIDDETVLRMLRWFASEPSISLSGFSSSATITLLVSTIASGVQHDVTIDPVPEKVSPSAKVPIIVDHSNAEALATAHVIRKMLGKRFLHQPDLAPYVLGKDQPIPGITTVALVICSRRLHRRADVLFLYSQIAKIDCKCINVVVDDKFAFPLATFVKEYLPKASEVSPDPQALLSKIVDTFSSIAFTFQPALYGVTAQVLEMKAQEISERINDIGRPRRLSETSVTCQAQAVEYEIAFSM